MAINKEFEDLVKGYYGDLDSLLEHTMLWSLKERLSGRGELNLIVCLPDKRTQVNEPSSKIQHLHKITFNEKTRKTNVIFKNEKDEYKVFSVKASEKAYNFYGSKVSGFLLAFIKSQVDANEFITLTNAVFGYGIDNIEEFLSGYAVRFFDSFRQMVKILDAVDYLKTQVNIKDRIILIEYK